MIRTYSSNSIVPDPSRSIAANNLSVIGDLFSPHASKNSSTSILPEPSTSIESNFSLNFFKCLWVNLNASAASIARGSLNTTSDCGKKYFNIGFCFGFLGLKVFFSSGAFFFFFFLAPLPVLSLSSFLLAVSLRFPADLAANFSTFSFFLSLSLSIGWIS